MVKSGCLCDCGNKSLHSRVIVAQLTRCSIKRTRTVQSVWFVEHAHSDWCKVDHRCDLDFLSEKHKCSDKVLLRFQTTSKLHMVTKVVLIQSQRYLYEHVRRASGPLPTVGPISRQFPSPAHLPFSPNSTCTVSVCLASSTSRCDVSCNCSSCPRTPCNSHFDCNISVVDRPQFSSHCNQISSLLLLLLLVSQVLGLS